MDENIYSSVFIIVFCGITLLIFHHYNKYKRLERYLHDNKKALYILCELCYYLVFVSLVFNARFIAYKLISFLIYKYYKIKITF